MYLLSNIRIHKQTNHFKITPSLLNLSSNTKWEDHRNYKEFKKWKECKRQKKLKVYKDRIELRG